MNRLSLQHLTFVGSEQPVASIEFGPVATVVRGPSNTGKSFIVDAIDYMLGSRSLKAIPELDGYTTVLLGLKLPSGEMVTLSRSIRDGSIRRYEGDFRALPLPKSAKRMASKHSARTQNSLSAYLLSSIGLDGRRIRKNGYNETHSLSFRNIARLCVIDETSMQEDTPPVLSGRPAERTKETSTLRVLLENADDSNLVASKPDKVRKQVIDAKIEVVDKLLLELYQHESRGSSTSELQAQFDRVSSIIRQQTASVAELGEHRDRLVRELSKTQRLVTAAQRSVDETNSLNARFQLLYRQYTSDLERLEMIAEAGSLLGYFNPGRCVFCGADPEYQHLNGNCDEDTTHFADSVHSERLKTMALREDLSETLSQLAERRDELRAKLRVFSSRADMVSRELRDLDSRLRPYQDDLDELIEARSALEKSLEVKRRIDELNSLKVELAEGERSGQPIEQVDVRPEPLVALSAGISARLNAWGVPGVGRVVYDWAEQEIVVGGQPRSAHGKGMRAILHAAFSVALAQYCFERDLPHPGFVILDSPLVTYRPPEAGGPSDESDRLPIDVAARFYADVQRNFDGQIVIIENMDPPNGLDPQSVDINFTKNPDVGHYGLFPIGLG